MTHKQEVRLHSQPASPPLLGRSVFVHLLVLVRSLGNDPDQVEEVLGFVAEEALKVADESVDVSLAGSFVDDVLVVVIPQTTAQLLVVHLWFVLPLAPASGHLVRVRHLELPAVAGPGDEVLAGFV